MLRSSGPVQRSGQWGPKFPWSVLVRHGFQLAGNPAVPLGRLFPSPPLPFALPDLGALFVACPGLGQAWVVVVLSWALFV